MPTETTSRTLPSLDRLLRGSVLAVSLGLGVALALPGATAAQDAQFENSRDTRLRQIFDQIDRNRDGTIDREEVLADRQRSFRQIDADGDNAIIEGEYMGYQSRYYAKNLTQLQFDRLRRKYYRIDRDHDGRVTQAEFDVTGNLYYGILDENRDGKVTWEEYSRSRNPLERAKSRGWSNW